MPPPSVTMVDANGKAYEVTPDQMAGAFASGLSLETDQSHARRIIGDAQREQVTGADAAVAAGLGGFLSGATFGLTDVAAGLAGEGDTVSRLNQENAGAAFAGKLAGAIIPSVLSTGGTALGAAAKFSPAGATSRLAAKIAKSGEAGIGRELAGGAVEGGLQNLGSYVSDVALGDRELSAEGFLGSMGTGALFGAGAVGALRLSSVALAKARGLFPKAGAASPEVAAVSEAGEVAPMSELESLGLADTPIPRARSTVFRNEGGLADDVPGAPSIPEPVPTPDVPQVSAPKLFTKPPQEVAESAVREADDAITTSLGNSDEMLLAAQRRIAEAQRLRGAVDEFGGGPDIREAFKPPATPLSLEEQLAASVKRLEEGESIKSLTNEAAPAPKAPRASRKPRVVSDPETQKIADAAAAHADSTADLKAFLGKTAEQRKADVKAWAAARRKSTGYVSKVPEGEGTVGLPRGRESVWRGADEARDAADTKFQDRYFDEPTIADRIASGQIKPGEWRGTAQQAEEISALQRAERAAQRAARDGLPAPADDVAAAASPAMAADDIARSAAPEPIMGDVGGLDVNAALRFSVGRDGAVMADDIGQAIPLVSAYEKTGADLAEALGADAPPAAMAAGKAWYQKLDDQLAKTTEAQASTAASIDDAMAVPIAAGKTAASGKAGGILGTIQDIATAAEVLHSLGIPGIPDPSRMPVVGPLLSMYLKARAMMMVGKRVGMKLPQTAETIIASKSANTQQRVMDAVTKLVDVSAKVTGAAAPKAAAPAAALSHVLFHDGDTKPKKAATVDAMLQQRRDELARALRPGAIQAAIRNQVRAADPELVAAIASAVERKMTYLDSKIPKPPILPGMMPGAVASWKPAPGQVTSFARTVQAVDDPASVLEHLASTGQVTFEAADALRNVYPRLYQEAQRQILVRSQDMKDPLPYARRVSLSVLFRIPLDGTMQPDYGAAMASTYQAPQGQPQGSAPPQPGMSGDVSLGSRTSMFVDQR